VFITFIEPEIVVEFHRFVNTWNADWRSQITMYI